MAASSTRWGVGTVGGVMGGKTHITAPLTVYTQRMSTIVSKLEIEMLGGYVLSIPELIYYPLYLN